MKDKTRSFGKFRHLERGTQVPDDRINQNKGLRMFEHMQRRNRGDATRNILHMTVDGKRDRGRPELSWRDLMKEDKRNKMTNDMVDQ